MTPLCELAEKYRSDKVASIYHDYTPYYHELLKDRSVRRVLEMGIGTSTSMQHVEGYKPGASLRMWRDYFYGAEIWGLDNDASVLFDEPPIHTMYCDQSSQESLLRTAGLLGGKFDLIVDDGSHHVPYQAMTANVFIPTLLSPSGVYVIEDVVWRKDLYPALAQWPVEVKIFNLKRTCDDCLFIIEGSNL